ncbi:MAG TPA: sulfite exporter TauE/SafE family protein [Gammaproteobacteria bacterium]|nr:sulfite exporter TauE/SafE family protein [Gammaproteobacteria bacterium]
MIEFIINIVIGGLLGVFGGLLGIGGGLFAIPTLSLLYGMDQQLAQGTALAMVVPNIMLGIYKYNQRNKIQWKTAAILGLCAFTLSWFGALIAIDLDHRSMREIFISFLIFIAVWNILQMLGRRASSGLRQLPWPYFAGLGSISGFLGGLFGVGSAVIATPVLTMFFGATQVVAQGLSLAIAVPTTAATLVTYSVHGQVDWSTGIAMAIGGVLTVGYGVRAAHSLPQHILKIIFSVFVLISAALLYGQL